MVRTTEFDAASGMTPGHYYMDGNGKWQGVYGTKKAAEAAGEAAAAVPLVAPAPVVALAPAPEAADSAYDENEDDESGDTPQPSPG